MSFTVYLDESGITDSQICVVAGFGATSLQWNVFTDDWRHVLTEYGIGEFHAQVFFGRDPQGRMVGKYKGWSQDKAGHFLRQLIGVLTAINPILTGTAISVVDFLALTTEQRQFVTGGTYDVRSGKLRGGATKTPFHVAMQNTTVQAAKFTPTSKLADFVCDDQRQYCTYVIERFNIIKARNPKLPLGHITHADSKTTLPLQAADLACYLAFQFAKLRLRTGTTEPASPFVDLIGNENRFDYFDNPVLQHLARGMTA
jgi:hypothetical protein